MINKILSGIFKLVIGLVSLLLTPIDAVIDEFLPSLGEAIDYVSSFLSEILDFIPWICSWFNMPQWFITFVISYYTFKLTVPLVVHTVKLAISWYDKLKP